MARVASWQAAVAKDRIEAFLLSPEAPGPGGGPASPPWGEPCRPCRGLQVSARPTPAITKGQALEIKASKLQWQEPRVRDATPGQDTQQPRPDKTLLLEEALRSNAVRPFNSGPAGLATQRPSGRVRGREVEISVAQGDMLVIVGKTGSTAQRGTAAHWGAASLGLRDFGQLRAC